MISYRPIFKYILFGLLLALLIGPAVAQRSMNSKNQDYTCVVMQKKKFIGGIGVRAGDPMGGTVKLYFLKRFAIEAVGGRAMGGINGEFHEELFTASMGTTPFKYAGHEVTSALAFQGRLVMHSLIPRGISGLDWYFGFGAQMRILEGTYDYFTREEEPKLERKKITTTDLGPEAILGVEFAFPKSPFSSFGEVSLFAKVNESRKFLMPQGGVGIRYNF